MRSVRRPPARWPPRHGATNEARTAPTRSRPRDRAELPGREFVGDRSNISPTTPAADVVQTRTGHTMLLGSSRPLPARGGAASGGDKLGSSLMSESPVRRSLFLHAALP